MFKDTKLFYLSCLLILILIDQSTKYLIRHFGGFYICNNNIAFGIRLPETIFWVIWLIIIFLLIFVLFNKYKIQNTIYYILILAGALGNIIDRFYFGCVIDFIDFKIWPVFNLADSFITLGVILIILDTLKKKKE
jgi:signal peptidase II